jgi:hypothetical protein
MWNWFLMLGGMLVWAFHFGAIYATSSIAAVISESDAPFSLWIVAAITLLCLTANAGLLAYNLRTRPHGEVIAWMRSVGAILAGLSFVAVAWQGIPALIGT